MDSIRLGIDTGGTYTDAVLLDESDSVIASTKVLTNQNNLASSIGRAITALPCAMLEHTRLVSLSTTLGTNAIVEGRGTPACLLLAGYDEQQVTRSHLQELVAGGRCILLRGAHDAAGNETESLDLVHAEKAIHDNLKFVTAFGISGIFSVRNPNHEIALQQLVRSMTALPVTCGHELAYSLDASRRAITVALNATLVPFIDQLIRSVQDTLNAHNIDAPLMIVKGDGSLVTTNLALQRPVETILSGPAASVTGALHGVSPDNAIVADMGGTTTDIAFIVDNQPVLSHARTKIGHWRPMVDSIRVLSIGLGGDSEVGFGGGEGLVIGPRRVMPICLLAHRYPELMPRLKAHTEMTPTSRSNRFAVPLFATESQLDNLSATGRRAWSLLSEYPVEIDAVVKKDRQLARTIAEMVRSGIALYTGYTPSDAAHVLGLMNHWSAEAAMLATKTWRRQMRQIYGWGRRSSDDPRDVARVVHEKVLDMITHAILQASLNTNQSPRSKSELTALHHMILEGISASTGQSEQSLLSLSYDPRYQLIAVGAPVSSYYPQASAMLGLRLRMPEHAAVASAIGAVVGTIVQRQRVTITQPNQGVFRVHDPDGPRDYIDLESAAAHAENAASSIAYAKASAAGAVRVEVNIARNDNAVKADEEAQPVFFESTITATASGRIGQITSASSLSSNAAP